MYAGPAEAAHTESRGGVVGSREAREEHQSFKVEASSESG